MIVRCSWCKRILGLKMPLTDMRVTHGGCKACIKAWRDEYLPKRVSV